MFLAVLFVLLLAFAASPQGEQVLEFVHLADTHVMDLGGVHPRLAAARIHYQHTGKALPAVLARIKRVHDSDFAIVSGDLVDAYRFQGINGALVYGQADSFKRIYEGSPLPLFLALGNHDIQHYGLNSAEDRTVADQSIAGEARAGWIRAIDCFRNGTYYRFEKRVGRRRYAFIVLDNGYYGGRLAGEKTRGGRTEQFAHEQAYWLSKQAKRYQRDIMILVLHVPLADSAMSRTIEAALAVRKNVALAFSGHTHGVDQVEELPIDGQPEFFQVRTPAFGRGENHWRRVRLYEDRIAISLTGKPAENAKVIALPVAATARQED